MALSQYMVGNYHHPYLHALRIGASNPLLSIIVGIAVGLTALLVTENEQKKIDK